MPQQPNAELHKITLTINNREFCSLCQGLIQIYTQQRQFCKNATEKEEHDYWLECSVETWMLYTEIVHAFSGNEVKNSD